VPSPDTYRGAYQGADAGARYAGHVDEALATLRERGIKPAAFIVDTIMSSAGVITPPAGYLSTVAAKIREAGAFFIADEVQPGFGRTGEHFWGFEADGFVPDIVTMGKPMGNGHPLAATVTRRELVDEFSQHAHYFNTFGGNPVSCAAGLAVLDVIENEKLQQNALDVGTHLSGGLWKLAERHEAIGDVRGSGLFMSVELVEDRAAKTPAGELTGRIVNRLRAKGVLVGSVGRDDNILKLRPPMVFSRDNADDFLTVLDQIFSER
jgi:4-aminobutyrate aminotransferase-like enzyme